MLELLWNNVSVMVYSTLIRNLINWEKFVNVPWLPVIMSLPSNNLMCPFYWKICLTNNSENVIYCTLSAYENGVCHTKQGNNQDQIIKNVTAIKTKFSIQNDPWNNQFLPQILWLKKFHEVSGQLDLSWYPWYLTSEEQVF